MKSTLILIIISENCFQDLFQIFLVIPIILDLISCFLEPLTMKSSRRFPGVSQVYKTRARPQINLLVGHSPFINNSDHSKGHGDVSIIACDQSLGDFATVSGGYYEFCNSQPGLFTSVRL